MTTTFNVQLNRSEGASFKHKGVTLIEMMIVIGIIGILAAITIPAYTKYAEKVRRSDAQVALYDAAQSVERCMATSYSYDSCTLGTRYVASEGGFYTISLDSTATTFTLTASGRNQQAHDEECSSMTLDYEDNRGPQDSPCWQE